VEQDDTEQEQAFTICEHALALVSQGDDWTDLGDASRIGHWSNVRFRVALLIPAASIKGAYMAHVLEVWDGDAKVLSAYWADPAEMEFRLFKPGEWRGDFLEA
jgi:hypothetical protein